METCDLLVLLKRSHVAVFPQFANHLSVSQSLSKFFWFGIILPSIHFYWFVDVRVIFYWHKYSSHSFFFFFHQDNKKTFLKRFFVGLPILPHILSRMDLILLFLTSVQFLGLWNLEFSSTEINCIYSKACSLCSSVKISDISEDKLQFVCLLWVHDRARKASARDHRHCSAVDIPRLVMN